MAEDSLGRLTTQTGERLQSGLRLAVVVIAAVAAGVLGLRQLVMHQAAYSPPAVQVAALAVLLAIVATTAVLVVTGRTWGAARGAAIGAVFGACAASYLALTDGVATYADWAYGVGNWAGLVVLLDRPLRVQVLFLGGHCGLALVNLMVLTDVDRGSLLRFATGSIGVVGYPLCVAMVAASLRAVARSAAAAALELERVRTAEVVAVEAARQGAQRIADLAEGTVPLLTGFASGTLDPSDDQVMRQCAVEAARMRRLFAELDVVADPLLHELRHCVDVADRKGIVVELEAHGRWPSLPVRVRRCLTDAPLAVLAFAGSWARVTVVGTEDLVAVNVFADCGAVELRPPGEPGVTLDSRADEDTLWVEVRWQPM